MAIQTYVFLDLEGTGLPVAENNQTKITELSFIAVSRSDLENASVDNLPPVKKISLLFNPQRKLTANAERITGLSLESLADEPLFKEKIEELKEFLDLPKPVCLVSHGGLCFDFRLLRAEFNDADVSLPTGLLCVDTVLVFKSILQKSRYRSLGLNNIYSVMFNKKPEESHRAEADTMLLLKCVLGVKKAFLKAADIYKQNLINVPALRKKKA